MRVLLCAAGTTGDVHPLVGIAGGLLERGHEVILLANPTYASLADDVGVGFEAIGQKDDLQALKDHPLAWTYKHGWKIWTRGVGLQPMRDYFAAIEKLNQSGETVVAGSYVCFGARLARERLGIPTATLHLNVHTIRSIHGLLALPPPLFLPENTPQFYVLRDGTPEWSRRIGLWLADTLIVNRFMVKEINQFRKELGLPTLDRFVREWWNSPDLAIGLFPDWWAGEHPDWPSQVVTTGFPFWDRSESTNTSSELNRFLGDDGKVVVYTPGASSGHTDNHFRAFAGTCCTLGYRGLILTARPANESIASDRIRFERFVPFRQLLPRTAAVVHHAGIGTSALCMAAGKPQVVIPTLYNQPDTAIRLEKLGVASRIPPHRFSEARLTRALGDLLSSVDVAASCQACAELSQGPDQLPVICQLLESLLDQSSNER